MEGRENPQVKAYSETGNAMAGSFGKGFGGIAIDLGHPGRAAAIAPGGGEGVDAGGCTGERLGAVRRENDAPGNGVVPGVHGE